MTQSFSVLPKAPPPSPIKPFAELPLRTQLFSVPATTPPPESYAELPTRVQSDITPPADSHKTPPPLISRAAPEARVAPPVSVKPFSTAPLVRYAHRTAPSPYFVTGI